MALPAALQHLSLPVIGAPLFIASCPALVIAQCKAGIVGSFPALNARPAEMLEQWLQQIEQALADHRAAHPDAVIGPIAVNQIVHHDARSDSRQSARSLRRDERRDDLPALVRFAVTIVLAFLRAAHSAPETSQQYRPYIGQSLAPDSWR